MIIDVKNCPHCSGDHAALEFTVTSYGEGGWGYAAPCPVKAKLIRVKIDDDLKATKTMKNFPLDPAKFTTPTAVMTPEMAVEFFLQNLSLLSVMEGRPASTDDLMVTMQAAIYATRGLAYTHEKA